MNFALCLTLYGDGKKALEFYNRIFESTIVELIEFADKRDIFGEMISKETEHYVYRVVLELKGFSQMRIVISDSPSILFCDDDTNKGNRDNIIIEINDLDDITIHEIYNALMEGGKSNKAPSKTDGQSLHGSLIDKFGICWNLYSKFTSTEA